jgi:hypothetical protein
LVATRFPMGCHTNQSCRRNLAIFCHWNIQWQHPFKDHQVLHRFEPLWTRLIVWI